MLHRPLPEFRLKPLLLLLLLSCVSLLAPHSRCTPVLAPAPPPPRRAGVEECVFSLPCAPPPSPPADQERAELAAGRRHLEARQALYAELQTQLDNCPESVREQLQEQLRRVSSTSPLPRPPWATAQTEDRRVVGQDHLAPAVLAGQQGRCSGLEGGTSKVGWGTISAPDRDAPRKGLSQINRGSWAVGLIPSPVSPGPAFPLPPKLMAL